MFTYESLLQRQFDIVKDLRAEVENLMRLMDIKTSEKGDSVVFVGRLLTSADKAFETLKDKFRKLGYTLALRHENGEDLVIAQRGVSIFSRSNPLVNVVLLLITIVTTSLAGATFANVNVLRALQLALRGNYGSLESALLAGAPFALTLLLILGVHEMGHYIAGRLHHAAVTLPYFIPMPFGLCTLGAFIQLKSPVESRKSLFDVGLAGPIAGFVVALPLFVFGLLSSHVVLAANSQTIGNSLLVSFLTQLILPHAAGYAVALSPIAIAAWFGILITGFNLLPLGQLDGGHVAYAVLGKAARPLAYLTFGVMIILGFTTWSGWFVWAFLALLTGLNHPEPLNDITPLDPVRKLIGILSFVWLLLIITPKPF